MDSGGNKTVFLRRKNEKSIHVNSFGYLTKKYSRLGLENGEKGIVRTVYCVVKTTNRKAVTKHQQNSNSSRQRRCSRISGLVVVVVVVSFYYYYIYNITISQIIKISNKNKS